MRYPNSMPTVLSGGCDSTIMVWEPGRGRLLAVHDFGASRRDLQIGQRAVADTRYRWLCFVLCRVQRPATTRQ